MFQYDKSKLGKFITVGSYATIHEYGVQGEGKTDYLVKCIPAQDMAQLRKFLEEFSLGFNNDNPFILNYKGLHTEEVNENGARFMVYIKMVKMKEGLRDFIRKFKQNNEIVPLEKVIWIFYSLANALSDLEAKHIVHNNVMHDSVFFEANGTVKLGGFGLSKFKPWNTLDKPGRKIYQSYLPPEERNFRVLTKRPVIKENKKAEKEEKKEKSDEQLNNLFDLFDEKETESEDVKKKREKEEKEKKEAEKEEKKEKKEKSDEQLNNSFDLFDEKETESEDMKKKREKEEKEKKEAAKTVAFKKDVWCLGKLIIDICLLRDEIERENSCWEIYEKVKKDLEKVREIYKDEKLIKILEGMLLANRKERPTFRDIFEDLQKSYPTFDLFPMKNPKTEEEEQKSFGALEDLEETKIDNEPKDQKTIEDFEPLWQDLGNFKKSYAKSLKDITVMVERIAEYKTHPQISEKKISKLNKAETELMNCYEIFQNMDKKLQIVNKYFEKIGAPQEIIGQIEKPQENTSEITAHQSVPKTVEPGIFQSNNNNKSHFGHSALDADQENSVDNDSIHFELYPKTKEDPSED